MPGNLISITSASTQPVTPHVHKLLVLVLMQEQTAQPAVISSSTNADGSNALAYHPPDDFPTKFASGPHTLSIPAPAPHMYPPPPSNPPRAAPHSLPPPTPPVSLSTPSPYASTTPPTQARIASQHGPSSQPPQQSQLGVSSNLASFETLNNLLANLQNTLPTLTAVNRAFHNSYPPPLTVANHDTASPQQPSHIPPEQPSTQDHAADMPAINTQHHEPSSSQDQELSPSPSPPRQQRKQRRTTKKVTPRTPRSSRSGRHQIARSPPPGPQGPGSQHHNTSSADNHPAPSPSPAQQPAPSFSVPNQTDPHRQQIVPFQPHHLQTSSGVTISGQSHSSDLSSLTSSLQSNLRSASSDLAGYTIQPST
eukprot:CAMPEP_0184644284 /NCGR_PEP_ID=MMETSP0308-20130426/1031_1 /TAXON_ID=38269 /ORGANISM="Gloeochaete witrockiana, Strain SAG 46.84" /LENGTH=365 /DNA_ID=CAMNT_0027072735 /DNA_START=828 /DNA_END=1924 /DNA_ORIENTATION=-